MSDAVTRLNAALEGCYAIERDPMREAWARRVLAYRHPVGPWCRLSRVVPHRKPPGGEGG